MMTPTPHRRAGYGILHVALLAGGIAVLAACGPTLSPTNLALVSPNLRPAAVVENPGKHLGQTLVVSGDILRIDNRPRETVLEVLAYPATDRNLPDTSAPAVGRFLLIQSGFLDPLVYAPGRQITAVARVVGSEAQPTGQTTQVLPVLQVIESRLLPPPSTTPNWPIHVGIGVMGGF